MKLIKKITFLAFLTILILFLVVEIWSRIADLNIALSSYIYWLIMAIWVFLILDKKLNSSFSLYIGFILFVISTTIFAFGISSFAETLMRLSFIGWLVGVTQALLEFKNDKK